MNVPRGDRLGETVRVAFRVLRWTVAGGCLALALTLFYWNRINDPRFFAFLETSAGTTLARVFGWYESPLERPALDKSEHRMTAQERAVKRKIAQILRAQGFEDVFEVSYRDVAFCREIAGMTVHIAPPYLILTDSRVNEVPAHIRALARAYEGFEAHFGPLTQGTKRQQLSHVLLFSDPADYLAYQKRYAVGLENASGFYSPVIDRLVLYEHAYEDHLDEASETLHTIRHEGAHQFLYAGGVHSRHRIENDWLVEGMATYLEGPEAGAVDRGRAVLVARALQRREAIPLGEFIGRRQTEGLLAYKPAELAYSEAWSLVHFLMQDERREAFFAYIKYLRDPANFREVRRQPRIQLLATFLEVSPAELQEQWGAYVERLAAGESAPPGAIEASLPGQTPAWAGATALGPT